MLKVFETVSRSLKNPEKNVFEDSPESDENAVKWWRIKDSCVVAESWATILLVKIRKIENKPNEFYYLV